MKIPFMACLTLFAAALSRPAAAAPAKGPVSVRDAWVRAVPPSSSVTAAYMVLVNDSYKPAYLVSARTDAAKDTEIHRMGRAQGMMTMEEVNRVPIPARGRTALEPNGYHLMLIGLKKPLRRASAVRLILRFRGGESLSVLAPVQDAADAADGTAR